MHQKLLNTFKLTLLAGALALLAHPLAAQSGETNPGKEIFQRFWEVEDPSGGYFYMNLKKGGRATGFWSDTPAHQMEHGNWEFSDDRVTVTWSNGYKDVLRLVGKNMLRESYSPGQPLSGPPDSEARAIPLDKESVGSMTNPDAEPVADGASGDAQNLPPLRSPLVGYWRIGDGSNSFYTQLRRDGRAVSVFRRNVEEAGTGSDGKWRQRDGAAHIDWSNGKTDVLTVDGAGATLAVDAGIGGAGEAALPATKVDAGEVKQFFSTATAPGVLLETFIGHFATKEQNDDIHFIHVKRFGGAARITSGPRGDAQRLRGTWQRISDGVHITWEDGSQETLRIGTKGTLYKSYYAQGSAVSGIPVYQSILTPTNEFKIDAYFDDVRAHKADSQSAEVSRTSSDEE